jgi:hypothetical protein
MGRVAQGSLHVLGLQIRIVRQDLIAAWLTDTSARPVATEWVSADWVGREP